MCSSGQYTERGIMRRHGYMAQYYVESPTFMNKIPKEIRDFAVLLEPMSVVQKGIDHTYLLQQRLKGWKPKFGMVLGAGPIGLLAAAVLRVRGLRVAVVGREDPSDMRAGLVKQLGAEYVCVANKALPDVPKETGFPDIVIEATGVSRVVFDAMEILGPNGVLCLLSVTGGDTMNAEPIDLINQKLVLGNQVVFGSVNANPRHFKQGVKDFVTINKKWPGVMNKLLTNKIPWADHKKWFTERGSGINDARDPVSPLVFRPGNICPGRNTLRYPPTCQRLPYKSQRESWLCVLLRHRSQKGTPARPPSIDARKAWRLSALAPEGQFVHDWSGNCSMPAT
jgi:threonine dehydrogenase-like Zn-dependent dehydrogenase